jgi:hypothetical protein
MVLKMENASTVQKLLRELSIDAHVKAKNI